MGIMKKDHHSKKRRCPICGSIHTARILWGLPLLDKKLEKEIEEEKISLGGCNISDNNPGWHCFDCRTDFGTIPYIPETKRDYRDDVVSITFRLGQKGMPFRELNFTKSEDGGTCTFSKFFSPLGGPPLRDIPLTILEWMELLDTLYYHLLLHEWSHEFTGTPTFNEKKWSLTIRLINGGKETYIGRDAFPPFWPELLETFRPFVKKAEALQKKETEKEEGEERD